jgi:hypothetical protein
MATRADFESKNRKKVKIEFKGLPGQGKCQRIGLMTIEDGWAYLSKGSEDKRFCAFHLSEERLKDIISISLID